MAQLRLTQTYCIDASSLIDLNRWYPRNMKIFFPIWGKIEDLVKNQSLISSTEVYREIKFGNDKLVRWCVKFKNMFLELDEEQIRILRRIERKYDPQYWKNEIGKTGAWGDPWIISISISHKSKIVTNENKIKSNRIPVIAQQFGIISLNLLEFFKEIGIK